MKPVPLAPAQPAFRHDLRAEWVPIASLRPWPRNPRVNDTAAKRLAPAIAAHGWTTAILVQASSGRVIAGHTRLKAAGILGLLEVPIVRLDVDDARATEIALADNRLGELAEWDGDELAALLSGLDGDGVDLDLLGWDAEDLAAIFDDAPKAHPSDDAPKVDTGPADSETGVVYELGPHRLICGDSTDPKVWDSLLRGERASLTLTDPPYGVGLNYSQHDDTKAALVGLAQAWLPIARDRSTVVVFTSGVTRQWLYPEPSWVLCWFFGGGPFCSPWGFNCWQPILAYGKDPSLAIGQGCRPDAVNMNVSANAAGIDHPCPKPLALWEWLLDRCSFGVADIIADPFAGSGTTIMACVKGGKVARCIEIDPRYCDVIRRRWTLYAGAAGLEPGPGALR